MGVPITHLRNEAFKYKYFCQKLPGLRAHALDLYTTDEDVTDTPSTEPEHISEL